MIFGCIFLQDVSGGGLGEENVIPVAGEDGQHYVVLEVIQLPDDGSGASQGVVQLPGGGGDDFALQSHQNITILPGLMEADPGTMLDTAEMPPPGVSQEQIRIKKEQERANCFGFDDSDDDV